MRLWTIGGLVGVLALGCGDDSPPDTDMGAGECLTSADCDDGVYCNGDEICRPDDPSADRRGCVAGAGDPCLDGQECDEAEARCRTVDCTVASDADGDGVDSTDCGGTDCDDADADAFPGNPEICDADGHDEDCDPETLGPDDDGDGYAGLLCCNGTRCGLDCDDTSDTRSPEGTEVCNGLDEDCDGDLDEGVEARQYRDLDGDGFGDPATGIDRACVDDPLFTNQADDCDDRDRTVFPGAPQLCDGRDNDCADDGPFDQDLDRDGHLALDAACEGDPLLPLDDCDESDPLVHGGAQERCNAVDDDCDGTIDETGDSWCTERARAGDDADASAVCGQSGGTAECSLVGCAPLEGDCDAILANGCEVDLATDPANCGGCGVGCPSGSCVGGLCEPVGSRGERFVDLAAAPGGACGVTDAGRAACWGDVAVASLRRPSLIQQVSGTIVEDVAAVYPGRTCLCLLQDPDGDGVGQLLCGGNSNREPGVSSLGLCDFVTMDAFTRVMPLSGLDDVHTASLAERHGCVVRGASRQVYCVGEAGLLGRLDGLGSNTLVPVELAGGAALTGVTDIDSADAYTCAVADRKVYCWGARNDLGQLARGSTGTPAPEAVEVTGLTADRVEVAGEFACALDESSESLSCWGANVALKIDGTVSEDAVFSSPVERTGEGVEDFTVSANRQLQGHFCRLRTDLDDWVVCRGGTASAAEPHVPMGCARDDLWLDEDCAVQVTGNFDSDPDAFLAPPAVLAAGDDFTCALIDGWPRCWGASGPLGSPDRSGSSYQAVPIPPFDPVVEIDARGSTACARTSTGAVSCWGNNDFGTAALGPLGSVGFPEKVRSAEPLTPVDSARAVAMGVNAACVIQSDRTVACWGASGPSGVDSGLLPTTGTTTLQPIAGLTDIVEIELGGFHGCARDTSNRVFCWGANTEGAVGTSGGDDSCDIAPCQRTPVEVTGIGGTVVELAVGGAEPFGLPGFSCARLADGGVSCWGGNDFGTLGRGTFGGGSPTPTRVPGIEDAVALRAGEAAVCALRADGRMVCWGADAGGTLGTTALMSCGTFSCATAPTEVTAVRDITDFGIGLVRTCATTESGSVWCWGGEGFSEGLTDVGPRPRASVPGVAYPDQLLTVGEVHCALQSGDVYCWGNGGRAVMGNGPEVSDQEVDPTPVFGL